MRAASFRPELGHIIVCANRRDPSDPLGSGCAERGDAVYEAVRDALDRHGLRPRLWLARSHCLGVCPKVGACVTFSGTGELLTEVLPADAEELVRRASQPRGP